MMDAVEESKAGKWDGKHWGAAGCNFKWVTTEDLTKRWQVSRDLSQMGDRAPCIYLEETGCLNRVRGRQVGTGYTSWSSLYLLIDEINTRMINLWMFPFLYPPPSPSFQSLCYPLKRHFLVKMEEEYFSTECWKITATKHRDATWGKGCKGI